MLKNTNLIFFKANTFLKSIKKQKLPHFQTIININHAFNFFK